MTAYQNDFVARGCKILQSASLAQTPENPRQRGEVVAKQLNVAPEQIVKVVALQLNSAPLMLLLPAAERFDPKAVSKLLGCEANYWPQDSIEQTFGSPLNALTPLAGPRRGIALAADGRLFDQDTLVINAGDPLVELLVDRVELRTFLGGEALKILDFESAGKAQGAVIEPRTLKGFRDYLPEEMIPRQAMIATVTEVFERFGFVPLQTPALEYSDILLGKMGADAEKLLFRFKDNGGRDVSMRYDLTVPLARVAAQYPELPKPFKRYQIAPVWRGENPGRGRFREFFQCDCDIVGSASLLYDAECIALGLAAMQALRANAEIRFSSRKVLQALDKMLAVTDQRQTLVISRTIDKLPSQGQERVRVLLKTDANCSPEQIERILRFVEIRGSNDEMLLELKQQLGSAADEAVGELRKVLEFAGEMTSAEQAARLKLDFSIARGLDYYTGTVYETFLLDLPGFGSVMSGGRYDNLIARYLGRPMPAVGISVGLDRLLAGLLELKAVQKRSATTRVMVVPMDAACVKPALKVLGQFRAAGVPAELSIENEQKPKLDKQLSLASKKGIPFAAIVGGNEVLKGTVMLKNLEARQQEELSVAQAIARLT